ncbi:MAG: HlyD family efflux transporter periplasmic adaptor subunit [Anaerolineales bacterium]|nr:HlyD family efflux transporter periplasmic adaptor subunit [Anaerolineales bacterium]
MIRKPRGTYTYAVKKSLVLAPVLLIAALLLAACDSLPGAPQEATPEPVQEVASNPVISATGIVLPAKFATLSMDQPGKIEEILVEEGDRVEEGDLLIRLEEQLSRETLEASLEATRLELLSAEMALKELNDNNTLAATQAQLTLANANDALDDAEYKWRVRQEGYRASSDTIAAAEANLVLAEKEVESAQTAFNRVSGNADDDPVRALALSNLVAAKSHRDSVLRNLNWYTGKPTELDQAILDAEVAIAQANADEALKQWEILREGPDPDDVMLLEARISNAQAQKAAAEAALADLEPNLELRAPFSGTITEVFVNVGEWVNPGQPVMLLADLEDLQIETTDLSEIDVAQIEIGEVADVSFDALPDTTISATIVRIADKSSEGSGVNYTVVLIPNELPPAIRWGMTAFVDIEV